MNPETAREAALAARYALSHHVPAMAHGFTIDTACGELTLAAEEARQHPEMLHAVESILQWRLHMAERQERAA